MLGREPLELLVHPLVLVALEDEERRRERAGGGDREQQADEREELRPEREPEDAHDRAGDDQRNEEAPL